MSSAAPPGRRDRARWRAAIKVALLEPTGGHGVFALLLCVGLIVAGFRLALSGQLPQGLLAGPVVAAGALVAGLWWRSLNRAVEFRQSLRGYAPDDVDRLLDVLAVAADNGRPLQPLLADVRFRTVPRGYDRIEVDAFLASLGERESR